MNHLSVPGAVRQFGLRVVSPTLPRVKAGFKTLYRQCQPANVARNLPKLPQLPRLGRLPWREKLSRIAKISWSLKLPAWSTLNPIARLPKLPQIKLPNIKLPRFTLPQINLPQVKLPRLTLPTITLPQLKLPSIDWSKIRLSASRAFRRRFNVVDALERAAFYTGYAFGTVMGLRPSARPAMLVATTATVPEAILLEPMLRALSQQNSESSLHLWASDQVCELYAASPFVAQLRIIKHSDPSKSVLSRQLRGHFSAAMGLGMRRFDSVICDPRNDHSLTNCFTRGARTDSLSILDRLGLEREERHRSGRLVRHVPLDTDSPDLFGAIGETAERFNIRAHRDFPAISFGDTAAQLAHSRSRSWRSEAAAIGATSVVAIIPCAEPSDVTIGLGMWAALVRELWSKHNALTILFPEGPDVAAVEQLSSLLGETPHARLGTNFGMLERAAMLARVDAVIGTAGSSSQLALAQSIPTVVAGSAYRRRLFSWARHRASYLVADGTGRLSASEMLQAYQRLVIGPARIRVAS
jgi:ADP-heptose:LPS heptosyltransferase